MNENVEKQEIKISKQKINDIKRNVLYAYLISFIILLVNSFFLDLDLSIEHSSKDYYGYSYWVTNEGYKDDFRGLFTFGSDTFESSWIVKIFNLETSSLSYDTRHNFLSKTLLGNIPYVIFGNFMLLTLLAIVIYFARREFIKFRSKYTIKIEDSENSNLIQKNNEKHLQIDYLTKLKQAYKTGLLTEDEYNRKISETNKTTEFNLTEEHLKKSIEEKIEEEKEKFRKLHSDGVFTYDEMQEKFRQIEKYHQSKEVH